MVLSGWARRKSPKPPIDCGESPTSRGRWRCRCGITIPRRWPPSDGGWRTEYRVSVVDINFGCPVKDVAQRAHSGSYLLRDPERVGRIVERVVTACRPTPVTAKIRLGCTRDNITAIEIATTVESAGAAALTVHGRTAQDFFKG